ncbi:uncharacterized protein LOC119273421 [Triticum dicoccoides]|uniref:Uncharacterized protein n=1 Tax=Triticum turgidum subsp. durum TaxID=4567 RepID=A0A9R0Q673_TRITD|nr:uncharacterized protein LOC119273421 [Triticum dicoccoides]VAH05687.1 unnamed protein product [Triticum turgidum subsp. durum]
METPLSTRRITRSLAAASAQKSAAAAAADVTCSRSKKAAAKGGDAPRPALHDITNDSPIVGLAAGGLVHAADRTPQASTAGAKNRPRPRCTPGSGEALLRGQVKTLLQKVDEEGAAAAVIRPVRIHALLGVTRSPAQLLAPTPFNTPQLWAESAARGESALPDGRTVLPCVLEQEELIPKLQAIADPPPNRALVFDDSPGKSDQSTDGSSLTFHVSSSDRSADDDSSSVWSIQVNVSSEEKEEMGVDTMGELEEEYNTEEEPEGEYYTEEEDWEDGDDDSECFDDLCEGMSKMSVLEAEEKKKVGLPAFEGRHTRFVYNSEDEIVERKEVENAAAEHGALLRGLPVPEGKHLRFHDDDDEEE